MQIALDMMPARRVNVDMDVEKYAMAIGDPTTRRPHCQPALKPVFPEALDLKCKLHKN